MKFLESFYLFSRDVVKDNDNNDYFVVTIIDSDGDKHRVYTERDLFESLSIYSPMDKIDNVPCTLFMYKKGDKAGAYGLNIDLRGANL